VLIEAIYASAMTITLLDVGGAVHSLTGAWATRQWVGHQTAEPKA
jgi:hypothetical protein